MVRIRCDAVRRRVRRRRPAVRKRGGRGGRSGTGIRRLGCNRNGDRRAHGRRRAAAASAFDEPFDPIAALGHVKLAQACQRDRRRYACFARSLSRRRWFCCSLRRRAPRSQRPSRSPLRGRRTRCRSIRRSPIRRGPRDWFPNGNGPWENVTTRSPSRFATTAYLLYDDKNLYVGFKAEQPGVPIVAVADDQRRRLRHSTISSASASTRAEAAAKSITSRRRRAAYATSRPTRTLRFRPRWTAAGRGRRRIVERRADHPARRSARAPRRESKRWRLQFVRGIAARGEHLCVGLGPDHARRGERTRGRLFARSRDSGPAAHFDLAASAAARPKPRADIFALGQRRRRTATSSNRPTARSCR